MSYIKNYLENYRDQFMEVFRDPDLFNTLGFSNDDRIEIFLGILQGKDDITSNFLTKLLNDYDSDLVLK